MAPVMDGTNDDDDQDSSLARNRSRRTKLDRHGRLAALAKLKEAKSAGVKFKPEMSEDQNVYEEVGEDEYSQIVRDRLEDDWIIDDGSGYVEDGREIFDEDAEMGASTCKSRKGHKKDKVSKNPNIRAPDSKPSNIKSLFAAAAVKPKKKVETVSLNEDDLLGNIMAELKQSAPATPIMPPPVRLKKKPIARNPFGVGVSMEMVSTSVPPSRVAAVPILSPRTSAPSATRKSVRKPTWFDASTERTDPITPSQDITEFTSQEDRDEYRASQNIEEDVVEPTEAVDEMDVSGIDFDDDFEVEAKATEQTKREEMKATPEDEPKGTIFDVTTLADEELLKASRVDQFHNDSVSYAGDIKVDMSHLPLTKRQGGEEVLAMYWIDAYEDYLKHPGVVYLFGKVWIESANAYVSCCVTVKNIERRIYLLPRKMRVNMKTKKKKVPTATLR